VLLILTILSQFYECGPILPNSEGIEQKWIAFYSSNPCGTLSEAKLKSSPLFGKLSAQQLSRTLGLGAQFFFLVKSFLTGVPQGKNDRRRTLGTSLRCCSRNAFFHCCTPRQNWPPLCASRWTQFKSLLSTYVSFGPHLSKYNPRFKSLFILIPTRINRYAAENIFLSFVRRYNFSVPRGTLLEWRMFDRTFCFCAQTRLRL